MKWDGSAKSKEVNYQQCCSGKNGNAYKNMTKRAGGRTPVVEYVIENVGSEQKRLEDRSETPADIERVVSCMLTEWLIAKWEQ